MPQHFISEYVNAYISGLSVYFHMTVMASHYHSFEHAGQFRTVIGSQWQAII